MLCANAEELEDAEGSAVMRQASSTHLSVTARRAAGSRALEPRFVITSAVSLSSSKPGLNVYSNWHQWGPGGKTQNGFSKKALCRALGRAV